MSRICNNNYQEGKIMNYNNLDYIQKNDPATKEDIEFVEKHINETIPKVYKEFLRYANGIVMNLCVLYDTSTIIESYECNEFSINMPGYISIGNDNGDRELIMKAEKGAILCNGIKLNKTNTIR